MPGTKQPVQPAPECLRRELGEHETAFQRGAGELASTFVQRPGPTPVVPGTDISLMHLWNTG